MPNTLTLTISSTTEDDYDGIPETVKQCTGKITDDDTGKITLEENVETIACLNTKTDTEVKTAFKTYLESKGYIWNTEI